jgi:hypothetical protein
MILKVAIMNPAPHLKLELEDKVLTNHTLRMNQEMKLILNLNMYLKLQNVRNLILLKFFNLKVNLLIIKCKNLNKR